MHRAIILIGAPGCGKGTVGRVLGTLPRFYHLACGDIFRSLDTRSEIGKEFVHYSSQGKLVPGELTIKLWNVQLNNLVKSHLYKPDIDTLILDGIPRDVEQAELLKKHVNIIQVFHLSCENHEELKTRIRKRSIKENRLDDASDKIIDERFEIYNVETKPLLNYFSEDIISHINSMQTPIKVLNDVISVIIENSGWEDLPVDKIN